MAGQYGVNELSKVLVTVCEVGNVLEKLSVGGGIVALFQLTDEFTVLAGLDTAVFKKEITELDVADRAELVVKLKAKLDLSDDKIERLIESGADLAVELVALIVKLVGFVKSINEPVVAPL